jgi:hypothetical protein
VGGGPDRRAPAGSEWEREEGKLGRAGFVGRKRRWAGLAGRLDRFVFFFSFFFKSFSNQILKPFKSVFHTNFHNLFHNYFKDFFANIVRLLKPHHNQNSCIST